MDLTDQYGYSLGENTISNPKRNSKVIRQIKNTKKF